MIAHLLSNAIDAVALGGEITLKAASLGIETEVEVKEMVAVLATRIKSSYFNHSSAQKETWEMDSASTLAANY